MSGPDEKNSSLVVAEEPEAFREPTREYKVSLTVWVDAFDEHSVLDGVPSGIFNDYLVDSVEEV